MGLLLVNKLNILHLDSVYVTNPATEAPSCSLQSQYCSLVTLELSHYCFLNDAFKQLSIDIGKSTSLHSILFMRSLLGSACVKALVIVHQKRTDTQRSKNMASKHRQGGMNILSQCNQNIDFDFDLWNNK